jgi:hypothetical protein
MKSLSNSNCNIAVCFSGQSRTFKGSAGSINSFFSSDKGNKYRFFGHTWDTNIWKIKPQDKIVIEEERIDDMVLLEKEIKKFFNFEKLIIEKEVYRSYLWASMMYSTMWTNFLKQQYEAENNMMFDLVIKARFDVCYPNNIKFEDILCHLIEEKTIYSYIDHMGQETFLPWLNDGIYCGTSLSMDLIDSFYNQLPTKSLDKLLGIDYDNPAYSRAGPGALLYKWGSMKNILFRHTVMPYTVYRKDAIGLDSNTQYKEIEEVCERII